MLTNLDAQLDEARLAVICAELATAKAAPPAPARTLRNFTIVKTVHRDAVSKRIAYVTEEHREHEPRAWARTLKALWRQKDPRAVRKSAEPESLRGVWKNEMYVIGPPVHLTGPSGWTAYVAPGTRIPKDSPLVELFDEIGALEGELHDLEDCGAHPNAIRKAAQRLKDARRPR